MTKTIEIYEFKPGIGEHINSAALGLMVAAEAHGKARMMFNDIECVAEKGMHHDEITAAWEKARAARAEAYLNSPEGKKQAADSANDVAAMQAKANVLVNELKTLDFKNDVAVLQWLCDMQAPSDRSGVAIPKIAIVVAFEVQGFAVGANTGKEFNKNDRDNFFRYLVGQALSCLRNGPSIHWLIHKMTGDWKKQFNIS